MLSECGKFYIRETGQSVKTRIKEYIQLRQYNMPTVVEYTMETNHKIALEDTIHARKIISDMED